MEDLIDLESTAEESPLRRGLLSSIDTVFEHNRKENERRIEKLRDHREAELAHSSYLKNNVTSPQDIREAKFVVDEWANKHSSQNMNRITNVVKKRRQNKSNLPVITKTNSRYGQVMYSLLDNSGTNKTEGAVADKRCHESSSSTKEHSRTLGKSHSASGLTLKSLEKDRQTTSKAGQQYYTTQSRANDLSVLEVSSDDSIINISDIDSSCLIETGSFYELWRTEYSSTPSGSESSGSGAKTKIVNCPVLNCNCKFSSRFAFDEHMDKFEHSPNNPWFDFTEDEKSATENETVMCPECVKTFKRPCDGLQHILDSSHVYPLHPIPVMGYLCIQCLCVFQTQDKCTEHMVERNHNSPVFPFSDDSDKEYRKGIPISKKFFEDYRGKCMSADFNIVCCECDLPIEGPRELQQHLDETRLTHHCMALTQSSKVEIFAGYFCTHKCTTCKAAVINSKLNGGFHNCDEKISGKIIVDGFRTFKAMVIGHCVRLEHGEGSELKIHVENIKKVMEKNRSEEPMDVDLSSDEKSPLQTDSKSDDQSKNSFKRKMDWKTFPPNTYENAPNKDVFRSLGSKRKRLEKEILPNANCSVYSHPDPSFLRTMDNIIFLDVDNWGKFFQTLPNRLPDKTFVWAFYGGGTNWKEPFKCEPYAYQVSEKRFHLHDQCGRTKDAADFAICLTIGKMDMCLPETVHFTILSGDKGFFEIERQMKSSKRKAVVINPHETIKMSNQVLFAMIISVGQS